MDAKKTAESIVAGMGEGDEKPEAPKLDGLMEELGSALKAGDWSGAAQAFRAAHGVCGEGYSEE
jgi:cation diffusion facilitator CzcD-associated flavoprotein CzcO